MCGTGECLQQSEVPCEKMSCLKRCKEVPSIAQECEPQADCLASLNLSSLFCQSGPCLSQAPDDNNKLRYFWV